MRSEVVLAVADDSTYQLLGMNQGLTPSFLDPGSRSWPCYILNSDFVSAQGTKRNLADTRPGALLNPSRKQNVDFKELMRLSPFGGAVEAEYGYLRTNSALADRIGGPVGRGIGASLASGITIRRNFSLTAAWKPEVLTDENGNASVTVNYPDSLTRWRLDAYAVGADGNTFGQATAFTRTSLPFQARLQTPRCLTTGDTADLGALLLNRTDAAINATATLAVKGAAGLKTPDAAAHDHLSIGAQGEQRTAWTVQATEPGKTELTLTARTETHADGVALTLPVHADGFWQDTAASGRLTRESPEQTLTLALPTPFDPNCAKVTVRFSPGCSAAMLDALPYLVDYPYGCVEQTMSRFLPAVVVRETLAKLGFSADEVEQRIMHRESAADSTRRGGTAGLAKLDEVVAHSLARLVGAQHEDGGFGWWPGGEATDPWMTAYVVWGLALADQNGVRLPAKLEDKAREALNTWIARAEAVDDTLAWALAAVTRREINEKEREPLNKVFARVLTERAQLTAYGRACLALASERLGSADEQALLLRNLENGMQRSTAEGFGAAVHWGSATNYWRATDSAVECTALTLLALQALDPQHPLIEPATNWLVLNRRSARWTNSRDTAFAVLALARNPTALDAASDEAEVEVVVNGKPAGRVRSNRETLITNRLDLTLPAELLQAGDNQVSLRLIKEEGPLYALALASAWAENASAKPAGHLMSVGREFERRIAQPTLAGTVKLTSQSLRAGEAARAGEEVVALVTLTVPNELEYVVVEVPKPAGCEPLNPLSGWDARLRRIDDVPSAGEDEEDQGEPIYREEHDDRSAFFLRHLPAGTWQIRFGLRATTAGDYRAAPVKAEAMYALEVRANTEARRVCIEPRH